MLSAYGDWSVSFCIATLSFGVYLPVRLLSPRWSRRWRPSPLVEQVQPVEQQVVKAH